MTRRSERRAVHPGACGAARDQEESVFAAILAALASRVPGARAAALVDSQGETVDYSGALDPFVVRVSAAHFRIVLDSARTLGPLASAQWIAVRAARRSFLVHALPEGYALVVLFVRRAGLSGWARAVAVCERALCGEAGWARVNTHRSWFPIDVRCDARGRPARVFAGDGERRVEVLGVIVRLGRRERGWRVRFDTGAEASLVREPGGRWYADEQHAPAHGTESR